MAAQHTPGPWTIEKGYDGTNKIVSAGCDDIPWNPHLADVWNNADAALIAAAPEMLTALIKMERLASALYADGDDIDGMAHPRCMADFAEARALLAKIEGKDSS